jgi:CRP/FNR family transcriptional regulator, cyclic AMP receptor protein
VASAQTQAEYIALLQRAGEAESFAPGDAVFAEGAEGDRMYIVKSGSVSIVKDGRVIETVGPGAIFGEMALIDHEPRSATAVAGEECELVSIEPRRFWYLVQETPYFAQTVMRVMADRLRRRTD